ncbi:Tat pathway signal protein [Rhodococcus sp. NPDC058505]|uniref:Tat pathway signal protein n=1 Tax=unclassified Rhodococcus (in: high G+C Gram-positive bacteria) TaxID=192944 RepID=UPI003662AEA2
MRAAIATVLVAVAALLTPTVALADDLAYLDVPLSNADAEGNGGVAPDLPTDPAVLGAALDRARAAGVDPTRYAALLQQFWLTTATVKAGLDLTNWDPNRGLAANEQNLANTFRYYERLQLENADFLWTGQGGMAGPSFAAGIMDVDLGRVVLGVRGVTDAVAAIVRPLDDAAAPAKATLPEDLQALFEVGRTITADDIAHFQVQVIAMSKHIFMDLIPQHEAYLAAGMTAIDEYRDAGLIDENAYGAWRDIATGDPDLVVEGNKRLLYREQYQSIGDQWDRARAYRGPVGRALTYLSTVAADPAIPGVVPPREAAPLTLTAGDVTGRPVTGPQWRLQTPLPAFNWSERDARWAYITEQMLPKYRALKEDRPQLWRDTLSAPMEQQILQQRALMRLPQMLTSMARTTQVHYR